MDGTQVKSKKAKVKRENSAAFIHRRPKPRCSSAKEDESKPSSYLPSLLPFAFLLLTYSLASSEEAALYFRLFGRAAWSFL
jgi:hypothetical protein